MLSRGGQLALEEIEISQRIVIDSCEHHWYAISSARYVTDLSTHMEGLAKEWLVTMSYML